MRIALLSIEDLSGFVADDELVVAPLRAWAMSPNFCRGKLESRGGSMVRQSALHKNTQSTCENLRGKKYFSRKGAKPQRKPLETRQRFASLRLCVRNPPGIRDFLCKAAAIIRTTWDYDPL